MTVADSGLSLMYQRRHAGCALVEDGLNGNPSVFISKSQGEVPVVQCLIFLISWR